MGLKTSHFMFCSYVLFPTRNHLFPKLLKKNLSVYVEAKVCLKTSGYVCCTNTNLVCLQETKEPVRLNLLTCQVKQLHVSEDPGKKCFDLVSSHGRPRFIFIKLLREKLKLMENLGTEFYQNQADQRALLFLLFLLFPTF